MAGMRPHGWVLWFAIIIILAVAWYFTTGYKSFGHSSTTAATTTQSGTTTTNAATTSMLPSQPCDTIIFTASTYNTSSNTVCVWNGGPVGIWVGAGNSANETMTIVGAQDHKLYLNQTSSFKCLTFYSNYTLPAQNYIVSFHAGPAGTNITSQQCSFAIAKLNDTLAPPPKVYSSVYNGNFSTGTYAGWTRMYNGFGPAPLNITSANNATKHPGCYLGHPWTNYNGNYFATTFDCGLAVTPGNLTSSLFTANKPFLNFKVISPNVNALYVSILYDNQTAIIAHYNTFNITGPNTNVTSTFRNASMSLAPVIGKPVQIRIVARISGLDQQFIAAGDFALSATPHQDPGVTSNYTTYNVT